MMCFGFVTSWQQLTALRALLGVFESALFPGAAFLISCWYPRKSMGVRNTAFYFSATGIGGLSSILAWVISQMHGKSGKSGW
jgi:MFS family permease